MRTSVGEIMVRRALRSRIPEQEMFLWKDLLGRFSLLLHTELK